MRSATSTIVSAALVLLVVGLIGVTGLPASAAEIVEHFIPARDMNGVLFEKGWSGLARSTRKGTLVLLDGWNAVERRWEPTILPRREFDAPRTVWAGTSNQRPDVTFDSIRRWDFPGTEPAELLIHGVARLLDEPEPRDDGVVLTIERHDAHGGVTILWGGNPEGWLNDLTQKSHEVRVTARPGDQFLFVVHAGLRHEGDVTEWRLDLALSPAPEDEFLASAGFVGEGAGPDGSPWEYLARSVTSDTVVPLRLNPEGWFELPPEFNEPWLRIYFDGQHPGTAWDAVRRWHYPGNRAREVRISGDVVLSAPDPENHDGVIVAIRRTSPVEGTDEVVWKREISGRDGIVSVSHDVITRVLPGDRLWFVVNAGGLGNIAYDFTTWDPRIRTYQPTSVVDRVHGGAITIGRRETIATREDRERRGLVFWPDGLLGVLKPDGQDHQFYTPNGGLTAFSEGSLRNPIQRVPVNDIVIQGIPPEIEYASGGPLFVHREEGQPDLVLLFYHAEEYPLGDFRLFHSRIGMAVRRPDGSFDDLGLIYVPESTDPSIVTLASFGTYVLHTDPADGVEYIYMYTKDTLQTGRVLSLTVARAPVQGVVDAARLGGTVDWFKYRVGSDGIGRFDSPALGHFPASNILPRMPVVRVASVAYNRFLDRYLMTVTLHDDGFEYNGNINIHLFSSRDALDWDRITRLEDEGFETFYCTLVGAGSDPRVLDRSFFIYYTRSVIGGLDGFQRWSDGFLARRRIALDEYSVGYDPAGRR